MAGKLEHDHKHGAEHATGSAAAAPDLKPKLKPEYFVPDQIMVYLAHPASMTEPELVAMLEAKATTWAGHAIKVPDPEPNPEPDPGPVPAPVLAPVPKKRFISVGQTDSGLPRSLVRAQVVEHNQVAAIVQHAFDTGKGKPISISGGADGVEIITVSPVWFIASTGHGIVHSGPGGKPSQADTPTDEAQWKFSFTDVEAADAEKGELPITGDGVTVVLLDTAPTEAVLTGAPDKFPKHPLVTSLLGSGHVRFDRVRDWKNDLDNLAYGAGDEAYNMSDHGLFAAGIIRTIAPKAELYLYEVLNPYGVGTIETIAGGLLKALELRQEPGNSGRRFLVNCSLMLCAPLDDHERDNLPDLLTGPILGYTNQPFSDVVDMLKAAKITIVAAAGNDTKDKSKRPAMRYPAAFDGVIGVGALARPAPSSDPNVASYSNLSGKKSKHKDGRDWEGLLTLGGEEGKGEGVLGIYLGNIPGKLIERPHEDDRPSDLDHPDGRHAPHTPIDEHKPEECTTGWAWWAGTSFAAPIVTGMLARLRTAGGPVGGGNPDSEKLVRDRAPHVKTDANGLREQVLSVKQEI